MNKFQHIAFKNIRVRRVRSVVVTLSIALSVAMIVATGTCISGVDEAIRREREADIGSDHFIVESKAQGTLNINEAAHLTRVRGVESAAPEFPFMLFRDSRNRDLSYALLSFNAAPLRGKLTNMAITGGRSLDKEQPGAVLLSADFAERRGIRVGEKLRMELVHGRAYKGCEGGIGEVKVAGLFRFGRVRDDLHGVMLTTWEGMTRICPSAADAVIRFRLGVDPAVPADEIYRRLTQLNGGRYIVREAGDYARMENFSSFIKMQKLIYGVVVFLTLMIGGHVIYSVFHISVRERMREFGLLRGIGATRIQVARALLGEAAVYGAAGVAAGVPAGMYMSRLLISVVSESFMYGGLRPSPSTLWLAVGSAAGMIVSLAAMSVPAVRASLASPVEAFRGAPAVARDKSVLSGTIPALILLAVSAALIFRAADFVHGLQFVCAGIFFAFAGALILIRSALAVFSSIFSKPAEAVSPGAYFAVKNLAWNSARSASAVSIVFSVAVLIGCVSGGEEVFNKTSENYLDKTLGADLMFFAINLKRRDALPIENFPGVEAISLGHTNSVKISGVEGKVLFIDPAGFFRFSSIGFKSGDPREAERMLTHGGAIILSALEAAKRKVKVGDLVTVAARGGETKLKVAGIAYTFVNVMSWDDGVELFGLTNGQGLLVRLEKGADGLAVSRKILDYLSEKNYLVWTQTVDEQKQRMREFISQVSGGLKAVMIAAVFAASLSVFNTMYLNVFERTRETAVLRALGFTAFGVMSLGLMEAVVFWLSGVVFAVPFTIYMMKAVATAFEASIGIQSPFVIPAASMAAAAGVCLVVTIAGGLYPAWCSARMKPAESLRYE